MSLSRPDARITVDGRELGADEAGLYRLRVDLAADGSHDAAALQLWPRSKFADTAIGASVSIALGARGATEAVWRGEITTRRHAPEWVALDGLAATVALSRTARAQTYLNQTVAQIVRDLAGDADIDAVDAELQLNAYHVDNRRPLWNQLRALARLVGADLGSAASGGLRFVPAAGAVAPRTLRYGAELLDWSLVWNAVRPPVAVAAYGSASEAGEAHWHWLSHEPVGAGAEPTQVSAPLATRDAAQAVQRALQQRADRAAYGGELLLQGVPGVRPGDAVQLTELPGADPGVLRVREVHHRFDATSGFLTRLRVEGGSRGLGGLA